MNCNGEYYGHDQLLFTITPEWSWIPSVWSPILGLSALWTIHWGTASYRTGGLRRLSHYSLTRTLSTLYRTILGLSTLGLSASSNIVTFLPNFSQDWASNLVTIRFWVHLYEAHIMGLKYDHLTIRSRYKVVQAIFGILSTLGLIRWVPTCH